MGTVYQSNPRKTPYYEECNREVPTLVLVAAILQDAHRSLSITEVLLSCVKSKLGTSLLTPATYRLANEMEREVIETIHTLVGHGKAEYDLIKNVRWLGR